MVAYSFQARFCEPIDLGTKGGTIRNGRKRHARPGEEMQLYTAMRTKHCRLVARKTCLSTEPIELTFGVRPFFMLPSHPRKQAWWSSVARDAFAIFDGFRAWDEMEAFWRETHSAREFKGVHIRWLPLPKDLL